MYDDGDGRPADGAELGGEVDEGEPRRQLARLISLLVEEPQAVRVREHRQGSSTLFKVGVAPDDLGKLIGRQGRTARALRTLLEVRGEGDGRKYGLEIRD